MRHRVRAERQRRTPARDVVDAMADAIRAVAGVRAARPFVRRVAQPIRVHARRRRRRRSKRAVLALFERAVADIDLRTHRGEHPRIGAVDVVPFVPLDGVTMADCVALARRVGAAVADRFERAGLSLRGGGAPTPARRNLEDIRRGEFEGLAAKMAAAGVGARLRARRALIRPPAPSVDRRADAAHRLQHQPGDRSARRREEDRRGHPAQQRRLPLREGDGHRARRPRHRPGLDEPDELREDADRPGRSRPSSARRRATAWRCSKARSSGWCRQPRCAAAESTCSSQDSTPIRCSRTAASMREQRQAAASTALQTLDCRIVTTGFCRLASASRPPRRRDAERPHLPVQVAALDAEHLGRPRHVALLLGERPQDQIALEPIARFVQRQPLGRRRRRRPAARAALGSRKPRSAGGDRVARHHDHQPLDHVAQLAHVARPGVVLQDRDRARARTSSARRPYSRANSAMKCSASSGMSSCRSRSGGTKIGITFSRK